jgi:hypothetical protein
MRHFCHSLEGYRLLPEVAHHLVHDRRSAGGRVDGLKAKAKVDRVGRTDCRSFGEAGPADMRPIIEGGAAGGHAGRPAAGARFEVLQRVTGQLDVVHEDAQALRGPVGGIGDVELYGLTGIGRQVHFDLLPAAAVAGECIPRTAAAAGVARTVHIVRQEGMDLVHPTGGATQAGAVRGSTIQIG